MNNAVLDGDIGGRDLGPSLLLQLGQQFFADRMVVIALLAGSSIVIASAWTRFARLTIPTSLPSRTTGTRLIPFVSSRSAISAIGVDCR